MIRRPWEAIVWSACCWLIAVKIVTADDVPATIQFNRDVRPILSDHCVACHGPDKNKRQADLRLDQQAGLLGTTDEPGVVRAGDIAQSELWRRIDLPAGHEEHMPPVEFGKELTETQRTILRRWIEQGAVWEGHWAFQPISRAPMPATAPLTPPQHPIDTYVRKELPAHQLEPNGEADRVTLIRRLSFDLTGLPPTPEEVSAFVNDSTAYAYERLVDRLLDSPRYGERMAVWWLDLVRYADSVGYHGDQPVSVFPYRDYVIRSFQNNKPFDQFTIEQLAGDLLPEATTEQQVAAGYNRLGMMSAEGGVQPKEYLAKYIAERVRNVSGTWMGVTLGCCECHNHKYDPFTSKDFYSLEAFFADIEERGLYSGAESSGAWGPTMALPTPEQRARREKLQAEITQMTQALEQPVPGLAEAQAAWEAAPPADGLPDPVRAALAVAANARTTEQRTLLGNHYRSIAPLLAPQRAALQRAQQQLIAIEREIPTTLVTRTVAPRMVRVLARGNWMDDSGAEVTPAVPEILPALASHEGRATRLELARWLVRPDHPLTARVTVNRLWKMLFGAGLSRKLDDLGAQGEWPSHPELLDHLAAQFIDSGWNVKGLLRYIVLSQTYRQSSQSTEVARSSDPGNRWLAHQSRFRIDAEFVRDNALSISGLLVEQVGGPSVKPYQPAGYWAYLNFPTREWQNGSGNDLYRRGLYTHWQRQYLHPSLLAFDAPCREECTAERPRSNTPLQSLVLLNDPTYVEAARALAQRAVREGGETFESRVAWIFQRAVSRAPRLSEAQILRDLYEKHRTQYAQDSASAQELVHVGDYHVPDGADAVELAAWTSVTRTVLNLHEVMTRN